MDVLWWVGAALLFIVVEVVSVNLVLIMFAGGAVAAAIANLLGAPVGVQFLLFAAVSGLLLFALRPWLLRRLRKRMPLVETNAAAQVGRIGVVVAEVGPSGGRVKLVGEVWSARTGRDGIVLPVGSEARVLRIDGATAIVAGSAPASAPAPAPRAEPPHDGPQDFGPPDDVPPAVPEHKEST